MYVCVCVCVCVSVCVGVLLFSFFWGGGGEGVRRAGDEDVATRSRGEQGQVQCFKSTAQ